MKTEDAFSAIPEGLRSALLEEYKDIVSNFAERRWSPAELSGGRFCEVVYTILEGFGAGNYATKPSKPNDFVSACRKLEQHKTGQRSFQILIPRLLPALYEVRNNRGVGHVGGDVDPNHMDATFVLSSANWIMGELVRVFHALNTSEAQAVVDKITDVRLPLIWEKGPVRRVLDASLSQKSQILVLLAGKIEEVKVKDLKLWLEVKNRAHFLKTLRELHKSRLLEYDTENRTLELLPPGVSEASKIIEAARLR